MQRNGSCAWRRVGLDIDGSIRQRLHRVAEQPGRHERRARLGDLHVDRQPRRDLEVGRRQRELPGIGRVKEHAGQRRDPRPGRHASLNRLQRLGQHVAIASELHRGHLPLVLKYFSRVVVVVPVETWITPRRPSVAGPTDMGTRGGQVLTTSRDPRSAA